MLSVFTCALYTTVCAISERSGKKAAMLNANPT